MEVGSDSTKSMWQFEEFDPQSLGLVSCIVLLRNTVWLAKRDTPSLTCERLLFSIRKTSPSTIMPSQTFGALDVEQPQESVFPWMYPWSFPVVSCGIR